MSTTIDALRNLGLKVNGEEPQSNYVNNVINEIADNYSPSEAGMSNPMTTAGDIIVGGTSGAPTRLAKGTQGQVLSVGSSGLEWANASSGGSAPYVLDLTGVTPDEDEDYMPVYTGLTATQFNNMVSNEQAFIKTKFNEGGGGDYGIYMLPKTKVSYNSSNNATKVTVGVIAYNYAWQGEMELTEGQSTYQLTIKLLEFANSN